MQNNNFLVPIAILIAGALIAWGLMSDSGDTNTNNDTDNNNNNTAKIAPVSENDHILGDPNAELVLIEYSDLECPFCKNFYQTSKQIIDKYGKDGQVALIFRHFPLEQLHSKAKTEAIATECAAELGGNDKFWEYTDRLFEITPSNNGLDLEQLPIIAEEIGLDVEEFNACMDNPEIAERVDEDFQDGVTAGVRGTPHSFLIDSKGNQTVINGAQPYGVVEGIIEDMLSQ